jgi:hypothetical protein
MRELTTDNINTLWAAPDKRYVTSPPLRGKGKTMDINENYIDGYVRSINISLSGKSEETQSGALMVVQGLLRFARGLKKENQTDEAMLDLLERLSRDMPKGKFM